MLSAWGYRGKSHRLCLQRIYVLEAVKYNVNQKPPYSGIDMVTYGISLRGPYVIWSSGEGCKRLFFVKERLFELNLGRRTECRLVRGEQLAC